MMTRRTRLTILVLILLVFLLLVIWLLLFLFSKPKTTEPVEVVVEETQEDVIPDRPTISEKELETEREVRTTSADVVSLSKSFVTRYGSYSNEADFGNLTDVLPLMSASFASETEAFIQTAVAPEESYGVTTSIITVTVDSQNTETGEAQVTIMTQREEAIGSTQNTSVKYQEVVLTFVMEDGAWKVDSANWQ